jgi:3-methylfumaryl-CoA hydratase
MSESSQDLAAWLGRTDQHRDVVTAGPLDRLSATLDRSDPPYTAGDPVPPLGHWLFFLPDARQSEIGPDGHPKRGGFLPPVHHLPRRMWAGSRVTFPGEIRVGDAIERRSVIAAIKEKAGRASPLVFVTVRHEIGRANEPPAIIDEHDIVYRGLDAAPAGTPPEPPPAGAWRLRLAPDAVQLFRYSALTFNSHRIHYDRTYVTGVEGYPGLVVHGPLIATLLVDLIRRQAPAARVDSFSFRAVSPLFDGNEMSVNADPPGADGRMKLWATCAEGRLAVSAEAVVSGGGAS